MAEGTLGAVRTQPKTYRSGCLRVSEATRFQPAKWGGGTPGVELTSAWFVYLKSRRRPKLPPGLSHRLLHSSLSTRRPVARDPHKVASAQLVRWLRTCTTIALLGISSTLPEPCICLPFATTKTRIVTKIPRPISHGCFHSRDCISYSRRQARAHSLGGQHQC